MIALLSLILLTDTAAIVCASDIEVHYFNPTLTEGVIVAPHFSIDSGSIDNFRIHAQTVNIGPACTIGPNVFIMAYQCPELLVSYNDKVLELCYESQSIADSLNSIVCEDANKPDMIAQAMLVSLKMDSVIMYRDSLESLLSGRNLELFEFFEYGVNNNIAEVQKYAQNYINLLNSETCEDAEIRLHGRLQFVLDGLGRIIYAHERLKIQGI